MIHSFNGGHTDVSVDVMEYSTAGIGFRASLSVKARAGAREADELW